MGRSTPTLRQSTDTLVERFSRMKSCMRSSDMEWFDALIRMGRKHSPEISEAGLDPETGFFISALMEILKKMDDLTQSDKV